MHIVVLPVNQWRIHQSATTDVEDNTVYNNILQKYEFAVLHIFGSFYPQCFSGSVPEIQSLDQVQNTKCFNEGFLLKTTA